MRFVIQRVSSASVNVDGNTVGEIAKGLLVFVGISHNDDKYVANKMINKLINMRIFDDENGKTNLSLYDVSGQLLIVSQFTLYADCKKGNRPSFINAAPPLLAKDLYEYICNECKNRVSNIQHGIFGADMQVKIVNDGPFTIYLDSDFL